MIPPNDSGLKRLREIIARIDGRVRTAQTALCALELDLLELEAEYGRYPPLEPPDLSEGRTDED